jgi:isopentenyldiphosphate isomerase
MKKEKVWVVDEQDNPIKVVNREDLKAGDIWRVSSVILIDAKERVLIAQRDFSKKYSPGLWGTSAAGTIESHETPEQNIQKELEEEVGVKLGADRFKFMGKCFYKAEHGTARFLYRFLVEVEPEDNIDIVLEEGQVADTKWIGIEELSEDIKLNAENYVGGSASFIELIKDSRA